MTLKIFRAVWFLSVLALFAVLLWNYAGWQEEVLVQGEEGSAVAASRDSVFYLCVVIFLLVNVLVYVIGKLYAQNEAFRSWFHGLIITINIFFIVTVNLIGLYNSLERFDYDRIGAIIYGSVGLIIFWAAAWPVYLLFQKFFVKQVV
jgi:hypothetical protein